MIVARGQGMEPIRASIQTWETIVTAARDHAGNDNLPIWSAMVNYYSVCIPSIVSDLSFKLWDLYQRIGGTKNETYDSYCNLPAFWVHACSIIDSEIARIDKVRVDKDRRVQQELLRRMSQKNGHKSRKI